MQISVVVPCYNEATVLAETHKQLTATLCALDGYDYEIVYVNDGSRDETDDILHKLATSDAHIRAILLSRNFGHQIAVTAGIEHATGDAVVLIDADLQDPPAVIAEMVARWRDGYDVIYGVRTSRAGETKFKLITAKLFYRFINRLSGIEMPLDVGDFRLMDRRAVNALLAMPERDRFLRGMVSWIGFKQCGVMYARAPRFAGETKYPLVKMARFAADAVLSFSFTPLRLAIYSGFIALLVAFGGILYALYERFVTGDVVRGWASLFIALLFMGGAQLITIGIIGEYIGRIYAEVKNRPLYFVRERLGFPSVDASKQNMKNDASQ